MFEFYNYITKLKKQLNDKSTTTNQIIEQFEVDPDCKTLPSNYIDMSENVLDTPIYYHDSLEKVGVNTVPLPADDTRAYHNPDFEKMFVMGTTDRRSRDPRWHCLRDYMICSTPSDYLPLLKQSLEKPSGTVHNYRNKHSKNNRNKN
jgi:hypothetical protein